MAIEVIKPFVQGDSFRVKLTHNPQVNVIGDTYELLLNKTESSEPALHITKVLESSDDHAVGIVYMDVTTEDTSTLEPGSYYLTIRNTREDQSVVTLIRTGRSNVGKVTVFKYLGSV